MKFRKIAAVLAGAVMLTSTVALAAAANYSAPFVSGGKADVAIVYGSSAANTDLVAALEINSDLTSKLAAQTATGSAGTPASSVSGGDSYKFEKPSTKFHIGDNFSAITTLVDDDELPILLADGKFVDDDNDEFDYTQKIEMNTTQLAMFDDNDYAENSPTIGFRIPSGYNVLNYTLTFVDQPLIADLVSTDVPLMGKSYYVLSNGTSGANLVLTLLDSAADTTLTEGETITVDVEGKKYETSISFISSTEVKLAINGQVTNTLNEGETQKLSDGSYVGIKDIMYNSKDTGISSVEFSIGSGKLVLTSGSEIQINDETINGIKAVMVNSSGTITSSTGTLTSIEIDWSTDDDTFVTANTSILMPGFEVVKVAYGGASYPAEETFSVEQGSSTYIKLNDFPLKSGTADIPLLYGSAGGPYSGLGKDSTNRLVSTNATSLVFDKDVDEQFVVTYESTTECESYLVKATAFGVDTSSNNVTTLQVYRDGAWKDERTVKAADTFSLGNAELGIADVRKSPANTVVVTANSSSTKFNVLCSEEGLKVWLPYNITNTGATGANASSVGPGAVNLSAVAVDNVSLGHNGTRFFLQMAEEDKDGNVASGDKWNVSLGWDSGTTAEPQVSDLIGEDVTAVEIGETDVFRSFMYSALATEFLWDQPSNDQDSIKIVYHGDEVVADVYLIAPSATVTAGTTSSSGGTVTALGSVAVADTEVSSVSSKNLVVIGGNCVNSVAAQLLGTGANCGADFESKTGVVGGQFLIQTFSYGTGKVATLVAGRYAIDTTNAAKYLTTQTVDTTVGKKYKGTSATVATLQTTTA